MSDSSPLYRDGVVYIGSGGGSMYALDASDGSIRWQWSSPSAITSTPVVSDGVLYAGRNDGTLVAIDSADGSTVFESDTGSSIFSDLAFSPVEEFVYANTPENEVRAFDAGDGGRPVWTKRFGKDVGSSVPVVDDAAGVVYFASNELRALSTDDGSVEWGTSFYGTNAGSSPVFDSGSVYLGNANGEVYRISPSGTALVTSSDWVFQTWDISIAAAPALTADFVVVGTLSGNVFLLDTASGSEIDQYSLPGEVRSQPLVDDGELFVASHDGGVYAFDL